MANFQVADPENKTLKRADHVWRRRVNDWLCVICGGVSENPPAFPTPKSWFPKRYERLSEEDRQLCPFGRKELVVE